jgi:hypothetical protein
MVDGKNKSLRAVQQCWVHRATRLEETVEKSFAKTMLPRFSRVARFRKPRLRRNWELTPERVGPRATALSMRQDASPGACGLKTESSAGVEPLVLKQPVEM